MTIYSKETALYNTSAIGDDIEDAGQRADGVITTVGTTGLKLHPSGQSGNNIVDYTLVNEDGMEVFDGGESVASFGADGARLGKESGPNVSVSGNTIEMLSDERVNVLEIGSSAAQVTAIVKFAKGKTGIVSQNQTKSKAFSGLSEISSGTTFYVRVLTYPTNGTKLLNTMYVSFVKGTDGTHSETGKFSISYTASSNTVSITGLNSTARYDANGLYKDSTTYAPAFTFGTRAEESSLGGYSSTFGADNEASALYAHAQGLGSVAASANQTALGKYNVADNADTYALIVGNGTSDSARSNALAVKWDGTVEHAGDVVTSTVSDILTAASGVTINSAQYAQWGKLAMLFVGCKKNAALTAGAHNKMATLNVGKRPPFEAGGAAPGGNGDCSIASDGSVNYRPTSTVSANTNVYIRITYLLA